MIVTIILAGGGHGTNMPMLFCYPVLFLFAKLSQGDMVTWIVMLLQFPVYGLLIDACRNQRMKGIAVIVIVPAHAGQVKIALNKRAENLPTSQHRSQIPLTGYELI